ncbi:potassium channel family protein [Thermodesulfobacteriota bacterium]
MAYNIVEKNEKLRTGNRNYIFGDAANLSTLKEADIENARVVIVTTHNDAMNIYLTFYCRQLRPDIQIVSRANRSRTISKLYTAGADMVMSYSLMGANAIISLLQPNEISLFMEGLNVFSRPVHSSFIGRSIAEIQIREQTGVSLLAINRKGEQLVNPDPFFPLEKGDELILIGTVDAENRFIEDF